MEAFNCLIMPLTFCNLPRMNATICLRPSKVSKKQAWNNGMWFFVFSSHAKKISGKKRKHLLLSVPKQIFLNGRVIKAEPSVQMILWIVRLSIRHPVSSRLFALFLWIIAKCYNQRPNKSACVRRGGVPRLTVALTIKKVGLGERPEAKPNSQVFRSTVVR